MARTLAASTLALLGLFAAQAHAAAPAKFEFVSRAAVMGWMDNYRNRPQPQRLPEAVHVLSEPEAAAFYVGFVAGVLGANPPQAEHLVNRMLPLPPGRHQWFVVRAIAYSGLPAWKSLLARVADRLPARRGLIDAYLADRLPALEAIELDKSPTFLEKVGMHLGYKPKIPEVSFGSNPEFLDTLWGKYFATAQYWPIWRIITILPWSKDRDSVERLTVGSSAKVTLANNAARYPDVLALIRAMAPYQDQEVRPVLTEVIHGAETIETQNIRKEQVALIEKLKVKGAGYQRDMKLWGTIGQGAIGVTCITLAAMSLTPPGFPT
jgi:hypothetical protein